VFIPQGPLFLVPFPALQAPDGDYLIQKHTPLTAPSIQVLGLTQEIRSRNRASGAPLIVGNPTMPSLAFDPGEPPQPLQPLPGTEQEAQAIGEILQVSPLIGSAATEAGVIEQISQARIVHLASHGLLDYGTPEEYGVRDLPGAIALAPGNGADGLLTSAEIIDLNLKADLVVLSACDTGRGRVTGDGVIGLSRAFIGAGVPSVVVSLWQVPDAPTAELMTEFYRQLPQTPDKAQALRQAMLVMLEKYPNPRDWAAFTLIGEAD
ncbi:MAG: CHAT domain-containing protein, partial [Cyanobacteria bacterium P01_A01_bin.114]